MKLFELFKFSKNLRFFNFWSCLLFEMFQTFSRQFLMFFPLLVHQRHCSTLCTSNKNFLANTFKKLAGKLSGTTHIMQLFYRHISRLQWDKTLKAVVIDNPRPINLEVSKWSGKIRIRRKVTKEALKYIIRRRLRVLNAIISNFNMQFNPK